MVWDKLEVNWYTVNTSKGEIINKEMRPFYDNTGKDDWIKECIKTNPNQIHIFQSSKKETKGKTTEVYDPISRKINRTTDHIVVSMESLQQLFPLTLQAITSTQFSFSNTLPFNILGSGKKDLEQMGVKFGNRVYRFGLDLYEVVFPTGWRIAKGPVVGDFSNWYLENDHYQVVGKITIQPYKDESVLQLLPLLQSL